MYVPELIFGTLLTSSKYEKKTCSTSSKSEKKTCSPNGFGAKLCNVFSTKFTVETSSKDYKRKFKQVLP